MTNFNDLSFYMKVNFLLLCVQFAIGIIGFIGNILVIFIFSRKSLRKYSYSFYCQMKACGDNIVLLFSFRNWANFILNANLDLVSSSFCVINQVLPYIGGAFAFGNLFLITVDRVFTVIYPNKFKLLKTKKFQFMVVALIAVYSLAMNIVLPFNTKYVVDQIDNETSTRNCVVPPEIATLHSFIFFGNILIVILVINNLLNIKLIKFILSSRKKVGHNLQSRTSLKDRRMAISGIGLSLTAFFCKMPLGIATIVTTYINMPLDKAIVIMYSSITVLVVENAASFFINMFLNSMFKLEFFKIIEFNRNKCKINNKNNNINNANNVDTNTTNNTNRLKENTKISASA